MLPVVALELRVNGSSMKRPQCPRAGGGPPPSSVTKTSPCSNGFIVPGSTLMYGSSFCIVTRRPRSLSNRPSEEAVKPFPRELATPPVTKMCLGIRNDLRLRRTDNGTAAYRAAVGTRGSGSGRPHYDDPNDRAVQRSGSHPDGVGGVEAIRHH